MAPTRRNREFSRTMSCTWGINPYIGLNETNKGILMADTAQNQLPMFYQNPVLLDGEKHKSMSLVKDFGLQFTKTSNAVPVNLVELP